jgi:hypothetical protein
MADSKRGRAGGISDIPQVKPAGPMARAGKRSGKPATAPKGPGGLGYVAGLDEVEKAEVARHTEVSTPRRN